MYDLILASHLIGALVLFTLICQTIIIIKKTRINSYIKTAKLIAVNTSLQLITGAALALLSLSEPNLAMYCSKMGLYIGITLAAEYILYKKARKSDILFPIKPVTVPVVYSIVSIFILFLII